MSFPGSGENSWLVFPDVLILDRGPVSAEFLSLGIRSFLAGCRYVNELPYGYNSDRDDLMILFKEKKGTCTTKHAVIASLAEELGLPVEKNIGIYAMTEEIVTGTDRILADYRLPYLPMVHCFLAYGDHRVDLTEGNDNGKNKPLDDFLYTEKVKPNITGKDEYLLYRSALKEHILLRPEMDGVDLRTVLHAREEGLSVLKKAVKSG
jgi:hypothetical protein